MNRYEEFFCNMNDEKWEHFSVQVLYKYGYTIETVPSYGTDGGKDYIVSDNNNIRYIVSCKHYIKSGKHVGADDEQNIIDRLVQFNAQGFIGFYSTGITSGLQNRLDAISENKKYHYKIFYPNEIANIMQYMDTSILQSFGLYPNRYILNVPPEQYKPLQCLICGKDILAEDNISRSMVGITNINGKWHYIYGCKSCVNRYLQVTPWAEIEQCLHLNWLNDWNNYVEEWISDSKYEKHETFSESKCRFIERAMQRQFPITDGTWCGLSPY